MGFYLKSISTTHVREVDARTFFAIKDILHDTKGVMYNNIGKKVKMLYIPAHIFSCVTVFLDKILHFEDL